MISIGIDLVEISRIEKSVLTSNGRFLDKYFSSAECDIFIKNNGEYNFQRIAGNFAAKEAFSKALKTGISGFKMADVSILRDENGAPYIVLQNKLSKLNEVYNFEISITNTHEFAEAIVLAEKK